MPQTPAHLDPLHWPAVVHGALGFFAFSLAPVALVAAKGGRLHKLSGRIYSVSMAVVALSAGAISAARGLQQFSNQFLFCLSLFSAYLIWSGERARKNKNTRGTTADIALWAALLLLCLVMICLGLYTYFVRRSDFGLILATFGTVALANVYGEWKRIWQVRQSPRDWLRHHIRGMVGSYIAAGTAFSAQQLGPFIHSALVQWLWPAAIGIPLIVYFTIKYVRSRTPKAIILAR